MSKLQFYKLLGLAFVVTLLSLGIGSRHLLHHQSPLIIRVALAQDAGILPGETPDEPKVRSSIITATVPDIIPPSVPILIAPEDNSLLKNPKPGFVWQASSDNVGVTGYRLFWDGNLLFDNISTTPVNNNDYTLNFNPITNEYTLIPKSNLSDGTHTWKIQAYDARNNTADSTTWTLKIDTQAPQFVVTKIEDKNFSISAFDINTIPSKPISLRANQPVLKGTGEAQSTVEVTVSGNNFNSETVTFTIANDGTWEWPMGMLPRDTIITLDFLIIDKAGNISILENLNLILKSKSDKPTVPDEPPLPTYPPAPTPTPTSRPIFPFPIPPIPKPPTPPLPQPPWSESSPAEWRHNIIKQVLPVLPPSLQEKATKEWLIPVAEPQEPQTLKHYIAPLLLVAPAAVSFGAIASLIPHLTAGMFWQILLLILPLLKRRNCSLVFAYQTGRGVPYATITYHGITETGELVEKNLVSDALGMFSPEEMPVGYYVLDVDHAGFPLGEEFRIQALRERENSRHWYFGETLLVEEKQDACAVIPVNQPEPDTKLKITLIWLAKITSPRSMFRWLWLLLASLLVFLYPSIFNVAILIIVAIIYAFDAVLGSRANK